ncbi:MAG: toprim domain-containing protein [Candidatus Nanohaloarchaea archaeon]
MRDEKFREKKELEDIVNRLDNDLDAIIVEGFSDKIAMKKLGFNGKIFTSAERTLEDLVEDVSRGAKKVAVLTDFDEHGKKQNKKISRKLEKKIDVIRSWRRDFGSQLTSTGRRSIEEVNPLFQDKDKKFVEAALDGLYFEPS